VGFASGSVITLTLRAVIFLQRFHIGFYKELDTGMADEKRTLNLNGEDIAFLLTLLRNATSPLSTQDLIDALRQRSGR